MTKQEKTSVTKKAKSIYTHIDFITRNFNDEELAYTISRIIVWYLILNSEGDKIKFWQNVLSRIYSIAESEKKIKHSKK